ncbi:DNA repair protein XRCC3-like [Culicoides brevitarsis]|uniref:DNA repair protein XRCC3-like n=1 Tax=Culicoides brevitarsis TaxID=469753 RepID=UPI00307C66C2
MTTFLPKIKFGLRDIDAILNGGIPLSGITEFFGESGSGKTQIAFHLALVTLLPLEMGGVGLKSVYISTGPCITTNRLLQMARRVSQNLSLNVPGEALLDHILVKRVMSYEYFHQTILKDLVRLVKVKDIGSIIIDSVGAIYRTETDYQKRHRDMKEVIDTLKKLSYHHNIAIVTINEVSAAANASNGTAKGSVLPALGPFWSTSMTSQIQVSKSGFEIVDGKCRTLRKMKVIKGPNFKVGEEAKFYVN